MTEHRKLRCAVYTRKSSEEGLDQAFNSLDAQREACVAYIASQAGLGWKLVPDLYDDGGISGGTLERPSVQRLLQHIKEGRIDVVVVYKIDRLTRSLMDFAKLVEIFDQHSVSFVSITQQFNTTTSMGRLTLNVLLSFAQFEREVTAERIRDKIAASKKKGMWMGGHVPLGYRAVDRKLIIDEAGAKQVRHIYRRYLELGSVYELIAELKGNLSKGGAPEDAENRSDDLRHPASARSRGMIYYLLSNPIYIGKIRHKGVIHDGEHEPIIDVKTFEEVQQKLKDQAASPRGSAIHPDTHTLTGLLFDEHGHRLTPVHTKCRGKRYRYYVSDHRLATSGATSGWRIAAKVLEPLVEQQLNQIFSNKAQLAQWTQQFAGVEKVGELLENASKLKTRIGNPDDRRVCNNLIRAVFKQITLTRDSLKYAVDVKMLIDILSGIGAATNSEDIARTLADQSATKKRSAKTVGSIDGTIEVKQAIRLKQRGVETRIIVDGGATPSSARDQTLIDMMARAHLAMQALTDGSGRGMKDVATMFSLDRSDLSRILPLAFLAPKITEAILGGRQQPDLTLAKLTREIELPIDWQLQLEHLAS